MKRILFTFLICIAGCANQGDSTGTQVVARIGDSVISVDTYDRMAAQLLRGPYRHVDPATVEGREKLLEAMISKSLLVMEGRQRDLHQTPEIVQERSKLETRLLHKAIYDRIEPRIEPPARVDLELFFYEAGFDEELRLHHIRCDTEAEAREILDQLKAGASLERLALEKGGTRSSRLRAGDLGYIPAAHMLPEVAEQLLSLEIGQVYPEPLHTRYGVHVFQLVDRRSVDFDSRRELVAKEYAAEAHKKLFSACVDSLKRVAGFTCDQALIEKLDSGTIAEDALLCTWDGGGFTVLEYRTEVDRREETADALPLSESVEEKAGIELAAVEARRLGYDERPDFRRRIRRLEEKLMAERLKESVVGHFEPSEAAMRAFFDAHPEFYGRRPTVKVLEILVAERDLAEQLRQRVDNGEPLEKLAREYNIREATRDEEGYMRLVMRDNPLLGPLAPLALDAAVGTLHGPIEVPGGFSVFRVEERRELPASNFAEVRRSIQILLRIRAESEGMSRFLKELRTRHADLIQIYPEALEFVLQGYDEMDLLGIAPLTEDESGAEDHTSIWK